MDNDNRFKLCLSTTGEVSLDGNWELRSGLGGKGEFWHLRKIGSLYTTLKFPFLDADVSYYVIMAVK